ncbi:amino acid ABC transporter permease [Uliginosibacterium paludis]|uniref:Amino acid ABC transporter permease n=1 Tax=Uliginosibacterium paludis TaxID=1615952 RepID=A0ABV2CTI6_9RHOO
MIEKLKDRDVLILVGAVFGLGLILSLLGSALAPLPAPIGPAAQQFADGALTTVELTLCSGAIGLVLGVLAAVGKRSHLPPVRWISDLYVWIIRGTPLMLQILFFFLALPAMVPELQLSEFWTAVLALSLNVGAYNAEVIRAGIAAVPPGQVEAARSLGLSSLYTFWDIVLPQAVRISLPPLANNMVALLKDSSLAYAIGVVELTMASSRVQAESFRPDIVLPTVAVVYLLLTTTFTQFAAALERKLAVGKR